MISIISVIVPLHNEENYIDRLMESLQSQTHRRMQIILIDGGSADRTGEICDRWASKWNMGPDSNMGIVEVIHTADKGVSASRNIGLGHATGTYVTFVDGDDYLKEDALERMLKALEDTDSDMCGCGFESVYPEGAVMPEAASERENNGAKDNTGKDSDTGKDRTGKKKYSDADKNTTGKVVDSDAGKDQTGKDKDSDAGMEETAGSSQTADTAQNRDPECMSGIEYIDNGILSGDMHVWGKLYKRELIGRQKFKEGLTIGEDMLFVTEYAAKCNKIARISYEGYNYFRNPKGAMGRPFTPSAMNQVRCYREERTLLSKVAPDLAFGPKLRANMLIGVMLTAGRIALLDKEVRKDEEHKEYVKTLKSTIREYKNREAMKRLDRGYRAKVRIFKAFPGLYMSLYHRLKTKR